MAFSYRITSPTHSAAPYLECRRLRDCIVHIKPLTFPCSFNLVVNGKRKSRTKDAARLGFRNEFLNVSFFFYFYFLKRPRGGKGAFNKLIKVREGGLNLLIGFV